MNIRPFNPTDEEYVALVALSNAAHPEDLTSVANCKHADASREAKYFFERHIVEVDGVMVANVEIGHTFWSFRPNKYFIDWDLHPDHLDLNEPILHTFEQKLLDRGATQLQVDTREDKPLKPVLLANGYEILLRELVSQLMIDDFDFSAYEGLEAHLRTLGITIYSVEQLEQREPESWAQKLEEADWVMILDVPKTDAFTREPFDVWFKTFDSPRTSKAMWFVAVTDEGDYVGLTRVKLGEGDKLYTGMTGVKREWRRKGIATALKVAAIRHAKTTTFKRIETDNEENNPMYALNMQLGFQPQPAWLELHKTVSPT